MKRLTIGFLLTPGFRNSDIVELDAILHPHPLNTVHYISKDGQAVHDRSGFKMLATKSFDNCPHIDIFIVGETNQSNINDNEIQNFIKKTAQKATHVIAISNGVQLLEKSSLLNNHQVTSDAKSIEVMNKNGLTPIKSSTFVHSGKFFTCGPSTSAIEAAFEVLHQTRGPFFTKIIESVLEYDPKIRFSAYTPLLSKKAKEDVLKVGILVAPNMYLPDVIGAVDVLNALPNTEFHYIWKEKQDIKTLFGPTIQSTKTFNDCPPLDVLIAGAVLPNETVDDDVLSFFKEQSVNVKALIGV